MILDRASTNETATYNYRLRMWVSSNYQVSGEEKYFTLKVNVYGNDGVVVEVKGIELDKSSETINLNSSTQLNATITPASPTDKSIIWTSSNESVAMVTNIGLVESKALGTTTITATTSNGKSARATINVTSPCLSNTAVDSCEAGTLINYKVSDTDTVDFYMLKDNGTTLTLLSANNIVKSTRWSSTDSNDTNVDAARAALVSAISNWNTTARMVTYDEAELVGCKEYTNGSAVNSCPSWFSGSSHH